MKTLAVLLLGIIFITLCGCHSLSLSRSKEDLLRGQPAGTVVITQYGRERLFPIPSKGIAISDLIVELHDNISPQVLDQTIPTTTPASPPAYVPYFRYLKRSSSREREIFFTKLLTVFFKKELTPSPTDDSQISNLIESITSSIQDGATNENIVQITENKIEELNMELKPASYSNSAVPLKNEDVGKLVRITRKSGDEVVIPYYHVVHSAAGAILLADGDNISLEEDSVLTEEENTSGAVTIYNSDGSSVLNPIEADKPLTVNSIWEDKINLLENPIDTVVSVNRALPNGRMRVFIVPLPLDDSSTDSSTRKDIMKLHKLAPGDTVHVGTLELLPIVLGSKIISKRLQLAALKEEFELEQMEAHEKLQRLKAFRQKMQSKREGNALVAPPRMGAVCFQ